jgi:HK97 family phage major capsid protein
MKSNLALEFKDAADETDPALDAVTKALAGFKTAFDDRLKVIETKSADDTKLKVRIDQMEAKLNRPGIEPKGDNDNDAKLETKAFAAYLRNPLSLETKTLRVSDDTRGGFFVPAEITNEFIRDLVLFSPIRSVASVKPTSFSSVQLAKRTGITNSKWKGELQTAEESEPVFGELDIPVREINTFVDISNQLLQDAVVDVNAEVRLALAEDFGQKEGLAFVSGSGPLQPRGLLTATEILQLLSGNATVLTTSMLVDVLYSLPAFYRNRGTWLLNSTTLAAIRKLQDTTGQSLWQQSLVAGQPETIMGRPVVEVPDMPDMVANATPIMFGDFASGYRIVDRIDLSTFVNPYTLATQGATRIHATRRVGADVIQPKALVKLKMATS